MTKPTPQPQESGIQDFPGLDVPWSEDLQELDQLWPMGRKLILPAHATVLVAGAYKGKVMDYMLRVYPQIDKIVGLEPQVPMWVQAVDRLYLWHGDSARASQDGKWIVEPYGVLATDTRTCEVRDLYAFETDECSLIDMSGNPRHATQRGPGVFNDWLSMLQECEIDHIDLFIMNMEGYEYTLLPWLLERSSDVSSFAVQFHEYAAEGSHVLDLMDEAYDRVIDEYPAWVYWRARE